MYCVTLYVVDSYVYAMPCLQQNGLEPFKVTKTMLVCILSRHPANAIAICMSLK